MILSPEPGQPMGRPRGAGKPGAGAEAGTGEGPGDDLGERCFPTHQMGATGDLEPQAGFA